MISKIQAGENRTMLLRTAFFGLALVVLAGVSGYFIFSVYNQYHYPDLSASGGFYTIQLAEVSQEAKPQLEKMAESELKELLGVTDLFLKRSGDDTFALCSGKFTSPSGEEVADRLRKIREFEYGDERPFRSADIRFFISGVYD